MPVKKCRFEPEVKKENRLWKKKHEKILTMLKRNKGNYHKKKLFCSCYGTFASMIKSKVSTAGWLVYENKSLI